MGDEIVKASQGGLGGCSLGYVVVKMFHRFRHLEFSLPDRGPEGATPLGDSLSDAGASFRRVAADLF